MRPLLSQTIARRLYMLEYFVHVTPRVKMKELTDALNRSKRSLQGDFQWINQNIHGLYVATEGEEVFANYTDDFSIWDMYRAIVNATFAFPFIQFIYSHDQCSMDEVVQGLYTSPSSIRRFVRRFNRLMGPRYKVTIRMNPFRFDGEESRIRKFLFYALGDLCESAEKLDEDPRYANIKRWIALFRPSGDDYFATDEWLYAYFPLAARINETRLKGGHPAMQHDPRDRVFNDPFLSDALRRSNGTKIRQEFSDIFGIPATPENMMEILYPLHRFTQCISTYSEIEAMANGKMDGKASPEAIQLAKATMHELKPALMDLLAEYDVTPSITALRTILEKAYNGVRVIDNDLQTETMLYNIHEDFILTAMIELPTLLPKFRALVCRFLQKANRPYSMMHAELVHKMISASPAISKISTKTCDRTKVLIRIDTDRSVAQNLALRLNEMSTRLASYEIDSPLLSKDHLNPDDFDLVISSRRFETTAHILLVRNFFPSLPLTVRILNAVNEIFIEKNSRPLRFTEFRRLIEDRNKIVYAPKAGVCEEKAPSTEELDDDAEDVDD